MNPQWGGHLMSRDKLNTLHFHLQRALGIKLCKLLTYSYRLSSLKWHEHLITWPKWCQATIWKNYISSIISLMVSKPGRVLTYGRRFSTQTFMLSLNSFSSFFFFLLLFLDGLKNSFNKHFMIRYPKSMWPRSNSFH